MTSPDAVVDHARLDVLRTLGPPDGSLLAKLVEGFLAEASASMAALHGAAARADAAAVHRGAHKLRGSAANLGATGVAVLCGELEALSGADDLVSAADLLRLLGRELEQVTIGLRAAVAAT